jgi:3-oxoadipate enol-lactonase
MTIEINGVNINVASEGSQDAMPVVFVHGFPFSHEIWHSQLAVTGKLYRAIAYDVRGHGGSSIGDGQYSIEAHCNDLIALLDHLKVLKAVVVGLSMGGYIALRAVERNPERFRGLVLCDTRSEADSSEGKIRRANDAIRVKHGGSTAFADEFVHKVFAPESFTRRKEATELVHRIIRRTPPLSIAGTLIALAARTDTTASLAAIAIPTLILVGEHDAVTPPAASQAMHERIPGAELAVVPEAAHMSNMENPEFFNEHLLIFLQRVAGAVP